MTGRVLVWVGWALVAVSIVGLAVYFGVAGFRLADTLGWIGAGAGVTGLGLAVAGSVSEHRGGQSVTGSRVGGNVTQVRGGGNVTIRRGAARSGPDAPAVPPVPAGGQGPPVGGDGQSVTGSRVGGHVDQVDGAVGDVDIRETP